MTCLNPRVGFVVFSFLFLVGLVSTVLAADVDGNGVEDADEQALIELFCPSLVLNGDDLASGVQICPEPVEIVTHELYATGSAGGDFAGSMRFFPVNPDYSWIENELYPILSTQIPNELEPNCEQWDGVYTMRFHLDYGSYADCTGQWSSGYEDQPPGWREIYRNGNYYEIPGYGEHRTLPGSEFPNTVYAHIYHHLGMKHIQYWYFYPFNDWVSDHEGDWEHIDVALNEDDGQHTLAYVTYVFHERYKRVSIPYPNSGYEFFVEDQTHPVIFVGGTANYSWGGHSGAGPGSHGSYPLRGNWHHVSVHAGGSIDIDDLVGGDGSHLSWRSFVDDNKTDSDGVVLLKSPGYAPPSIRSWLQGDLHWGHIYVHGFWDNAPSGEWDVASPRGPRHQSTWESEEGNFEEYSEAGNPTGNTAWTAPTPLVVTAPAQNQPVSGVLTLTGTVSYASEVVVDYGAGSSPASWSELGITVAHSKPVGSENPVSLAGVIATWNTGVVPTGPYTIRVRTASGGEIRRTVSVSHQNWVVASSGGNYQTIQAAMNNAQMGDTIRVSGEQRYESVTMKPTVQLISLTGNTEIFGADDQPTITIEDHSYPCRIKGFVIRHNYIDPTQMGGTTEHGVKITDASPIFQDCIFTGNSANRGSGARIIGDSRPTFEDCLFESNHAALEGSGAYLDGGSANFIRCTFTVNYVSTGGEGGSAISMKSPLTSLFAAPSFVDCVFRNNDSPGSFSSTLRMTSAVAFTGCLFTGNETAYLGRITGATPHLTNCTIVSNGVGQTLFSRTDSNSGLTCTKCIVSSNGGPLTTTGLASSTTVAECVMYNNASSSAGPADNAWGAVLDDPAFCDAANGDYHVYAFSPAAPKQHQDDPLHFDERVGAFDVGCVPTATITVSSGDNTNNPPGAPTLVCPQGETGDDHLIITVGFDDDEVTRPLFANELSIQPPYLTKGIVSTTSPIRGTGPSGYVLTLDHPYAAGYGTNDQVTLYLDGHVLAQTATFVHRSYDMKSTSGGCTGDLSCPDGKVTGPDMAWFGTHFGTIESPKPYHEAADYAAPWGTITGPDFAKFATHFVSNHKYPLSNDQPLQTTGDAQAVASTHVSLEFTEEYPTALEHKLYVDVTLEDCAGKEWCVFVIRPNRSDLTFSTWLPSTWAAGSAPFFPMDTETGKDMVFGVFMSNDTEESTRELGRLVFDVAGSDPMTVSEDQFVLTFGELEITPENQQGSSMVTSAGPVLAQMSGVHGRVLNMAVQQVFHNRLEQNFPNPFNPQTTLAYSLKEASDVSLTIYDVAGRRVREVLNEHRQPGAYKAVWDGRDGNGTQVASGVYFYKLVAGSFVDTKKMVMLK